MLNLDLIKERLGQYGIVWLCVFLLVAAAGLGDGLRPEHDLIKTANILLQMGFVVVGLALLIFAGLTLVARETWLTKLSLLILGVLLSLPLFWSPVLGVIVDAGFAKVSIEYSSVYAGFRILVGKLTYTVTEMLFGSPLVDAAWKFMQGFATLVGFVAAVANAWRLVQALAAKPATAA